ncbi:MAG: YjjG family noncanonical pyrimidine nucleotidase [Acutalibacteraceae bacterium]|nr:YjjG family noncanonical pyrimidine nucleotidase [Acutalibacteraceae bacterium]
MSKFTTVFVDADETLFDFHKGEQESLKNTLLTLGIEWKPQYSEIYSEENQKAWISYECNEITRDEMKVQRFKTFFDRVSITVEIPLDEVNDIYIDNLSQCGYLFDGTLDFLERLIAIARVYITTNALAKTRNRFKVSGLDKAVHGIFISENIGCNKPAKEYFEFIFDRIGITDKSKVVILGDSLTSDMQGGRNAGIKTCLYDPQRRVESHSLCDYVIHSYDEFFEIINLNV